MTDVEDIVRLTHDYALYNDTFRIDELMSLFATDAFFDMAPAGLERYDGVEKIREFFEKEERALSHVMHITSNHRIDVTADTGVGTVYYHAMGITRRGGHENQARGYYEDTYRKTADGWRFASRRSCILLPWEPILRPQS